MAASFVGPCGAGKGDCRIETGSGVAETHTNPTRKRGAPAEAGKRIFRWSSQIRQPGRVRSDEPRGSGMNFCVQQFFTFSNKCRSGLF